MLPLGHLWVVLTMNVDPSVRIKLLKGIDFPKVLVSIFSPFELYRLIKSVHIL